MRLDRLLGETDIITAKGSYFNMHFSNEANLSWRCTLRLAYLLKSIMFTMI